VKRPLIAAALTAAAAFSMSVVSAAADAAASTAAAAQFRLAQRLAADGAADASAAFEKVVTLAPGGPLADDALIGLARVHGAPEWPEDLPRVGAAQAQAAAAALGRAVADAAQGDRANEAKYLGGLLQLAPVASRDPRKAREELIAVATAPGNDPWHARARYALGYLAEIEGVPDRAAGAYARVIVEWPEGDAAVRARVGFARTQLQLERFGDAAAWLQSAIDAGAPDALGAPALRELAARELLRAREPGRRWAGATAPLKATSTTRGASLLATSRGGAIAVFDRKNSAIQIFDTHGAGGPPIPQNGVTALANDAEHRLYAAAGDTLMRWDGAAWSKVAALGAFAEASALAVDPAGAVWIVDRRGDRVARLGPGAATLVVVHESKGGDLGAIAAVGGRVIVAEAKSGRLLQISPGAAVPFGPSFRKPAALAADAAGRLTVLDVKAESLTRLAPSGAIRDTMALPAAGVSRPLAIATADDGTVRILDGSTGSVAVAP